MNEREGELPLSLNNGLSWVARMAEKRKQERVSARSG
jgi:hypothetical protein